VGAFGCDPIDLRLECSFGEGALHDEIDRSTVLVVQPGQRSAQQDRLSLGNGRAAVALLGELAGGLPGGVRVLRDVSPREDARKHATATDHPAMPLVLVDPGVCAAIPTNYPGGSDLTAQCNWAARTLSAETIRVVDSKVRPVATGRTTVSSGSVAFIAAQRSTSSCITDVTPLL